MKEEEIKQLKVRDVVAMPEFLEEMERQVEVEQDSQTAAIKSGRYMRTPLDRLRERGVFTGEKLVQLYEAVLGKTLIGYSASEREYISRMGLVCFGRVLARLRE